MAEINILLKSTQKGPNGSANKHLWLNILSADKEKDGYIISFETFYELDTSGEKIKANDFIYKSPLKEFTKKEQKIIEDAIQRENNNS